MKHTVFMHVIVGILFAAVLTILFTGCKKTEVAPNIDVTEQTVITESETEPTKTNAPENTKTPVLDDVPESEKEPVETGDVHGGFDTVDGRIDYSVTVESEGYTHTEKGTGDRYYVGDNENVFLEIRYIENTTVSALKPSFMDHYVDFENIEYAGDNYVGDTKIIGNMITAQNGAVCLDAWLIDTEGGVLGVVVSYTQENRNDQMAQLYDVLNTLELDINNEN
jgi:hypothetical protein